MPPYLGLPSIPPDLKAIAPYLQRADETKSQDPIISYWCAYYAAQIGISLKAASAPNRAFLSALLTALESLRSAVGPSDAVTVDSASSAYVENFALRVFASADGEDRRGIATVKTAKKFVAAATFFDVLNVFEDRGPWEAHEEKVRYSKWRAADINRALREGRQPAPPPGSGGGEPAESATTTAEPSSASALPVSPPAALTEAPDAHVGHEQEEAYSIPVLPAVSAVFGEGDPETSSPFEIPRTSAPAPIDASDHPQAQALILTGSPEPPPPPTLPQRPPAVDMEQGRGRSPSIGAAPLTPSPTTRPQRSISPTHFIIQDSPPPPPPPAPFDIGDTYPSAPPLPPLPPSAPYVQIPVPSAPPLIETSPPAELTPGQIAKTQKHCRFAISALDYEDAEQARKELRAALAILGG